MISSDVPSSGVSGAPEVRSIREAVLTVVLPLRKVDLSFAVPLKLSLIPFAKNIPLIVVAPSGDLEEIRSFFFETPFFDNISYLEEASIYPRASLNATDYLNVLRLHVALRVTTPFYLPLSADHIVVRKLESLVADNRALIETVVFEDTSLREHYKVERLMKAPIVLCTRLVRELLLRVNIPPLPEERDSYWDVNESHGRTSHWHASMYWHWLNRTGTDPWKYHRRCGSEETFHAPSVHGIEDLDKWSLEKNAKSGYIAKHEMKIGLPPEVVLDQVKHLWETKTEGKGPRIRCYLYEGGQGYERALRGFERQTYEWKELVIIRQGDAIPWDRDYHLQWRGDVWYHPSYLSYMASHIRRVGRPRTVALQSIGALGVGERGCVRTKNRRRGWPISTITSDARLSFAASMPTVVVGDYNSWLLLIWHTKDLNTTRTGSPILPHHTYSFFETSPPASPPLTGAPLGVTVTLTVLIFVFVIVLAFSFSRNSLKR